MSHMTPSEIVSELDKHIVGQDAAKRAVAIALRNRWRRQQVPEPLRQEITPKNILMIGPTGVGKTEIARRLARLADAPFVKVEATKFTEVGYVGRDVDTIIRDLVEAALKQTREAEARKVRDRAADAAEERLLDVLLPPAREVNLHDMQPTDSHHASEIPQDAARGATRRQGGRGRGFAAVAADGDHGAAGHGGSDQPAPGDVPATGRRAAQAEEDDGRRGAEGADRRGGREAHQRRRHEAAGARSVEQNGIVFLDEIDKIAGRRETHGADVSREGVQRDLLPLVEGTTVSTATAWCAPTTSCSSRRALFTCRSRPI